MTICFQADDSGSCIDVRLSHAFISGPVTEKKNLERRAGDFGFAKPGCFLGELFLLWFSRILCADIYSNHCFVGAKLSDTDPVQRKKLQVGQGREKYAVSEELFSGRNQTSLAQPKR